MKARIFNAAPAIVVVLLLIGLTASRVDYVQPIAAILLLVASGWSISRVLPQWMPQPSTPFGKIGFAVLCSHLAVSVSLLASIVVFTNRVVLTSNFSVVLAALIAIASTGFSYVRKPQTSLATPKLTRSEYIPYVLVALVGLLPYAINPYAQNNDGFLNITLRYLSGSAVSTSDLRPIFPSMMAFYTQLTGLEITSLYSIIAFILFTAGVWVFGDYLIKRSAHSLAIGVTAVIMAPVVFTEIYITRPQVVLLAYVLPLLCLASAAIQKKSLKLSAVGMAVSTVLVAYHELSGVFFLLFAGLAAYSLYHKVFVTKAVSKRTVTLGAVIAFPYALLLPLDRVFGQLEGMAKHVVTSFSGLHPNWWFLDSYISVDGSQIGWSGFDAIYYYLFNGLILYIVTIACWFVWRKRAEKGTKRQLIPAAAILGFFFFFAEIAPRLGFYFLPNRSWPYIALATIFILAHWGGAFKQLTKPRQALSYCALFAAAAVGLFGTATVAQDNVAQVFPEEQSAAKFLATQTDPSSLVVSNQPNKTLVELYGKRTYATLVLSPDLKNTPLNQAATSLLESITADARKIETKTETTQTVVDALSGTRVTTTTIETRAESRPLSYQPESIYYIFSKRKATGRNAERTSQYSGSGSLEQSIWWDYKSYTVVYEDEFTVIVRLN